MQLFYGARLHIVKGVLFEVNLSETYYASHQVVNFFVAHPLF